VLVLGIETSCDETAVAVVQDGVTIRSNVIGSQIEQHRPYGGVVPEIAARAHLELLVPVLEQALGEAGVGYADLDGVAVTVGPGLVGALLVGVAAAKSLALAWDVPLIGVNHLEGHVCATQLASGRCGPDGGADRQRRAHQPGAAARRRGAGDAGRDHRRRGGRGVRQGRARPGLPYPGGPEIDRLARDGDPAAIAFPRALLHDGSWDFSLSGLKSAVVRELRRRQAAGVATWAPDVAASFQEALVEVQVAKTVAAARATGVDTVTVVGGVAANSRLRAAMAAACEAAGLPAAPPAGPVHRQRRDDRGRRAQPAGRGRAQRSGRGGRPQPGPRAAAAPPPGQEPHVTATPPREAVQRLGRDQVAHVVALLERDFGPPARPGGRRGAGGRSPTQYLLDALDRGEHDRFVVWPGHDPIAVLYFGATGTLVPAGDPRRPPPWPTRRSASAGACWSATRRSAGRCWPPATAASSAAGPTPASSASWPRSRARWPTCTGPPRRASASPARRTSRSSLISPAASTSRTAWARRSRGRRGRRCGRGCARRSRAATHFVVERGGVAVGKADLSLRSRRRGGQIAGVYVDAAARGQGVASGLIGELVRMLLRDGHARGQPARQVRQRPRRSRPTAGRACPIAVPGCSRCVDP
jgi:N6-L-threonylcarbamoyladenine synthase